MPGTDKVSYRIFEQKKSREGVPEESQKPIGCFPLKFRGLVYGELSFNLSDPDLFTPYIPFIENLSHMIGVIFEERRQRQLKEAYKNELELRVFERTRQLEKEMNEHQRSQELLDAIINNTQNVIYVRDLDGRFTLVNKHFCEIFKLNRNRIIGRLYTEIFTEDWAAQHIKNDRMVINKREPVIFNEYAELPDGRHEYISIKFPILGDTGAVAAVGGISTDITELKNTENALRLDEARLEALLKLFQMTNAGMKDITDFALEEAVSLTKSKIGYLAFTNADESLLTMYSWSKEAMKKCAINEKQIDYIVSETGLWGEAIRQRKPVVTNDYQRPGEFKKGYPDGHVPIFRHMNVPVFEGEHIVAVAGVGNKTQEYDEADIRQLSLLMQGMWRLIQRMKADDEKGELEKRLRQAYKMESIGTLAGGIAHDFNNILSAIFGYAELSMSKMEPGTFVHGSLQSILKAAERARDLVRHILAFSRQGDQELMPVLITPIVKEVAKFMKASLPASIEIRQKIKSAPTVLGDPTQIHQVIMNLCTNAGQAMQDKGGILEIALETMELDAEFTARHIGLQPGAHVKLTVSDTGYGISSKLVERIFDPFFTTKEKGAGTGMGLSVAHGIVNSHGGIITVFSDPGKSSVFNVFLPTIERRSSQEIRPEKLLVGGSERILFIDDEETLVKLGVMMLGSLGYKVTGVTSGTKALAGFKEKPDQFDVIITDLTMPKISGDHLAREFLKIKPDIPIILCTGFSASVNENTAIAMGIRAFVNKPILKRQLSETVRKVLDRKEVPG